MFRASSALLVLVALASVGPAAAQNVLGIDFGSEWIKLAVVQRSAGVQIVLNEVTAAHARVPEHPAWRVARVLRAHSCTQTCFSPAQSVSAGPMQHTCGSLARLEGEVTRVADVLLHPRFGAGDDPGSVLNRPVCASPLSLSHPVHAVCLPAQASKRKSPNAIAFGTE